MLYPPRRLIVAFLLASTLLSACAGIATPTVLPPVAETIMSEPSIPTQPAISTQAAIPTPGPTSELPGLDKLARAQMAVRCAEEFSHSIHPITGQAQFVPQRVVAQIEVEGNWSDFSQDLTHSGFAASDHPSSADYLVCIRETRINVGSYTDNAAAYRREWEVLLVSFPGQEVLRSSNFTGGEPPGIKGYAGPGYGARPVEALAEWLEGFTAPPPGSLRPFLTLQPEDGFASTALAFTPDGQTLVSGQASGGLSLWQLLNAPTETSLPAQTNDILDLSISPDGSLLAAVDRDGQAQIINLTYQSQVASFGLNAMPAISVALLPQGDKIVAGGANGQIAVYDIATSNQLTVFGESSQAWSNFLALAPDGKTLAGSQPGPAVVAWNLESGQELFRLAAPEYPQTLAWVDGGQKLAGLFLGGEVRAWDASGQLLHSFQAGQVERAAFSADGLLLATAGVQGGVKLWDLQTGALSSLSLIGPDELITALAFSPDSQRLAAAVWDSPIVVWDLSQGSPAAAVPPASPANTPTIPTASSPTQAGWTYLADLKPNVEQLGYGTYSVGTFKFSSEDPADDVHTGDPIRMHGVDYPQGIFAHAPARFTYTIDGQAFSEFQATLGLIEKINCGDGVEFVLLLDGQEIYHSPRLQQWSTPLQVQVSLPAGSQLSLVVEMGDRSNKDCDWAIWGDPRLR